MQKITVGNALSCLINLKESIWKKSNNFLGFTKAEIFIIHESKHFNLLLSNSFMF